VNWTDQIDVYCERTDLTFWSEPINALTNIAFLIAAIWMWNACKGLTSARVLCAILFAIGVGSFLFHTTATGWAAASDVIPIGLFILFYLFLVHRDFIGLRPWVAGLATLGFVPYAAVLTPLFNALPFFEVSNFYWTVPVLLLIYAGALYRRMPDTARGMIIGAGVLIASITLRSVDESLCHHLPIGTHIFWHLLNALMLGWMIEVYRRHMTATR